MHSAYSKHWIKVVSKNAQFYFKTKLKANLNRWKFNIENENWIVVSQEKILCSETSGNLFKKRTVLSKKKIYYSCEGRIEKFVPQDHRLSSLGKPVMPNGDPRDWFFYATLTLMIDSYNLTGQIFQQRANIGITRSCMWEKIFLHELTAYLTWAKVGEIYWNNKVMSALRLCQPVPNVWTHFI